jgi:hypothetical protein
LLKQESAKGNRVIEYDSYLGKQFREFRRFRVLRRLRVEEVEWPV